MASSQLFVTCLGRDGKGFVACAVITFALFVAALLFVEANRGRGEKSDVAAVVADHFDQGSELAAEVQAARLVDGGGYDVAWGPVMLGAAGGTLGLHLLLVEPFDEKALLGWV
jgi:hypothetical protein